MRHGPVSGGRASVVLDGFKGKEGCAAEGLEPSEVRKLVCLHRAQLVALPLSGMLGLEGTWLLGTRHLPPASALCGFVPPTCLGASPCRKEARGRAQGDGGAVVRLACPACRVRPAPGQPGCDLRGPAPPSHTLAGDLNKPLTSLSLTLSKMRMRKAHLTQC